MTAFGKFLLVNLSKQSVKEFNVRREDVLCFLGGSGLAAKLYWDLVPDKEIDPFSPENPLIFSTGPLTGTAAPCSGRHAVCSKSPQTGIWGESTSGGFFGAELRRSGIDGLIIVGKADRLTYLSIVDGEVEFCNGEHLRGMGFYQTQQVIRSDLGEKRARVCAIGLAGENLVKFSAILNDHGRAAGRTGLGAVMGSKNLKAIAVKGSKRVEQSEEFVEHAKKALEEVRESFMADMLKELGTAGYVEMALELGDLPAKYYQLGSFRGGERISGIAMLEHNFLGRESCFGCPIGCGRRVRVESLGGVETQGPEYETIGVFGPLCMNDDLETIYAANYLCNDYGLDTISCGAVVAYLMYLSERGVLEERVEWGDSEKILELIRRIAKRESAFDYLIGEGIAALEQKYGVEAAHYKGLDVPMHDPRAFVGMALVYATSPRGACHMAGDCYQVDLGMAIPEFGIEPSDRFEEEGKAKVVARLQNYRALFDSMVLCKFASISVDSLVNLLSSALETPLTAEDLLRMGERIIDLKRVLNIEFGMDVDEEWRLKKPIAEEYPDKDSKVPNLSKMLEEYYAFRRWDRETGLPFKEKLEEESLGFVLGASGAGGGI